ncbi:pupal cuticle protein C1B [Orussus abietinus]|uniref:pupal cuticle protein C1B n=1 Tax=Orussus abietinus TaxID=222816 RepID=UPI000625CE3A|nr:pupal cuticle protein C1B [Orussus abietinus]
MFRFVALCGCLLAVAHAGVIGGGLIAATAPAAVAVQPQISLQPTTATLSLPTVATSSSNIIRGIGNSGTISAYHKTVDTAFTSERNGDVRINNPDVGIVSASAPAVAVTNTAFAASPVATAYGLGGPTLTTLATGPAIATGLGINGLGINGLGINGLGVNGLGVNGLGVNGLGVNGLGYAGLGLNGLGVGHVKVL